MKFFTSSITFAIFSASYAAAQGVCGAPSPYSYSSVPATPGSTGASPPPVTSSAAPTTVVTSPSPATTPAPSGTGYCPAPACLASVSAVDACATDCIESAGSALGCASLELDCQCSNYASIQAAAAGCVVAACGGASVANIIAEASAVCQCNSATPGSAC